MSGDRSFWNFILRQLFQKKIVFCFIVVIIALSSSCQYLIPKLSALIMDGLVNRKEILVLKLAIIGQIVLSFGKLFFDTLRTNMVSKVGAEINMSVINSVLSNVLQGAYNSHTVYRFGLLRQLILESQRIEIFISSQVFGLFFSIACFLVSGVYLLRNSIEAFLVVIFSVLICFLWTRFSLKRKIELDNERFQMASSEQILIGNIVAGIQDVKYNQFEEYCFEKWRNCQDCIVENKLESLKVSNYQKFVSVLIMEGKNYLILYLCVLGVLENNLTVGVMLAIQFIVAQMSIPADMLVGFSQAYHLTKKSWNRVKDDSGKYYVLNRNLKGFNNDSGLQSLPLNKVPMIEFKKVSFSVPGKESHFQLSNLSFSIPPGKWSVIVGNNGSGKTTILKCLTKFYQPCSGEIAVNGISLSSIDADFWSKKCSCVFAESAIFNDTIAKNIALSLEIDESRIEELLVDLGLGEFVNRLPLKIYTELGDYGIKLSTGNKQRLLLARALYRNVNTYIFDEPTGAIDGQSESRIIRMLRHHLKDKTVIFVTHRLSAINDTDNVIFLASGRVMDNCSHFELIQKCTEYRSLIQNSSATDV